MFDQLVESRPHRDRSTAQALGSIVAHTAIIAVSIQLTRAAAATVAKAPTETEMILTRAPAPKAPQAAAVAAPAISAAPLPITIPPLAIVPAVIPPVEVPRSFDPGRFERRGDPRGLPPSAIPDNAVPEPDRVAAVAEVDEPAEYLDGPQPTYPPALRHAGIEGSVQLCYIVGMDGRVELESIRALRSSNPAFEVPAIDAIRQSHFRPARIKGRKVRQLVEQVVRFTLR